MRLVALLCIFYLYFEFGSGCHVFTHQFRRRRREVGFQVKHVHRNDSHDELREFFTDCINQRLPEKNWSHVIDYTVLHSQWFINTEISTCRGSADSVECWQQLLHEYMRDGDYRYNATMECISLYPAEFDLFSGERRRKKRSMSRDEPVSRDTTVLSRQKRDSTNATTDAYADCLQELANGTELQHYDFNALAEFIKDYNVYGLCKNDTSARYDCEQYQNAAHQRWYHVFNAMTRTDSILWGIVADCNEEHFPDEPYWTEWLNWGRCSRTCLQGIRTRKRHCITATSPSELSNECEGDATQFGTCVERSCCPGQANFVNFYKYMNGTTRLTGYVVDNDNN